MREFGSRLNEGAVAFLTLFTSAGTLICCALPILLVSLGFSAVVVGLTATFPWLITLSGHKAWVFTVSAVLLAAAGLALYRRGRRCPADPRQAHLCGQLDRWNRRVYWAAVALWVIGFFFAYLLLPLTLFV
ncbi:MAG TPA: hypothetical protein PKK10_00840 [Woeseiaceae bacterium]|nr:hypothetical protein [Woeseiaceae bacterium]